MRIAYAGAPGAFAHEACLTFAPDHDAVAVASFAEVVEAVAAGRMQAGMLPLRNSRAGPVPGIADLLGSGRVAVRHEHVLPVRLHLLALPSADLGGVRLVRSHPMALAQCADRLRALGLGTAPTANTATAARALSSLAEAALASEAAARAYGLHILMWDLQDDPDNRTVFGLVVRGPAEL